MKRHHIFIVLIASIAGSALIGCANSSKDLSPQEVESKQTELHTDYQNLIASEIDDPLRAKEFAALSAERDRLVSQHAASVQQYSKKLRDMNLDYSTEREQLDNLIQEYNQERRAAQTRFLVLMGKMKATVTAKEWETLAKFELKNLNPRTMSYTAGGQ
ncbi:MULTISPECIES: hypothetical protein [unclassified Marinobacter]|uniref:hypothetical protein n=1 Tax=unclassified Marinobacter TaxID=83889 RepID=UPI0026E1ADC8|nr:MULTISPECIES: hypothetical protein [unclassified Marinobacter]MDO6442284.1 hypothetical protein [Marinobacter sp. 2_MG-2023]MDO6824946.1 hypothetical protein [Marinobacter sp. 1_MG-2023]